MLLRCNNILRNRFWKHLNYFVTKFAEFQWSCEDRDLYECFFFIQNGSSEWCFVEGLGFWSWSKRNKLRFHYDYVLLTRLIRPRSASVLCAALYNVQFFDKYCS